MHSRPKCEVSIRLAVEPDFQRVGKLRRIEVGRSPAKTDGGSRLYGTTENFDIFRCPAHASRDNRLPPQ
jgi:hypothetical protein